MNEKGLNKKSIFDLAEAFVRLTKKYHLTVEATWENPVRRFGKRRKEARLLKNSEMITGDLLERYKGIMFEIYNSTHVGDPALSDESWQRVQDTTWFIVQDKLIVMNDHRQFFGLLWGAYKGRMKDRSEALSYKPKFMLLPFVDAIPGCEERRVLLMAYGIDQGAHLTDKPLADLLGRAFSLLHSELLKRSQYVDVLTDSLTNGDVVEAMSPPFRQLQSWILHI